MDYVNEIFEGIHYSRFAASWHNSYRGTNRCSKGYRLMVEWLMSLTINGKKIDYATARNIANFAYDGKLELEESAEKFIANEEA